ncbi:MAG: hypothetical protein BIFFINMI_02091 [Phycisphaerae bacterium]|nr:hypothetical protein [Phycisphaerae bacterium]
MAKILAAVAAVVLVCLLMQSPAGAEEGVVVVNGDSGGGQVIVIGEGAGGSVATFNIPLGAVVPTPPGVIGPYGQIPCATPYVARTGGVPVDYVIRELNEDAD